MTQGAIDDNRAAVDHPHAETRRAIEFSQFQRERVTDRRGVAPDHHQLVAANFLHDDVAKDA
jgi:hypothetical protein